MQSSSPSTLIKVYHLKNYQKCCIILKSQNLIKKKIALKLRNNEIFFLKMSRKVSNKTNEIHNKKNNRNKQQKGIEEKMKKKDSTI